MYVTFVCKGKVHSNIKMISMTVKYSLIFPITDTVHS